METTSLLIAGDRMNLLQSAIKKGQRKKEEEKKTPRSTASYREYIRPNAAVRNAARARARARAVDEVAARPSARRCRLTGDLFQ